MKRKAVTLQLEGEIPQPQSAYDAAVEEGYEGSEEQYGKELAAITPTQEQFDAIPGRLSKLTTTTEKSDFHHITDSAADKVVDFAMEGKTEQRTMSGKNLCDLQVGKKFNPFTGEIGELATYAMCIIETTEQMDVTISIPSGEEHGWYLSYMYHKDTCTNLYHRIYPGQSKTITLPEGITMLSGDAIIDPTTMADEFKPIKVQIEAGSTATDYEPYTGAQPSPNPDYPQEIINAGTYNEETGRYEIECSVGNKNHFNVEKAKDESNYLRNEGTIQYYFFPVYIGAGNTFTFSWKLPTGNELPDYTVLIMDAVGGNVINYVWYKEYEHWTKESYTLVSPNDYIYIRINKNELPPWWEDFTDIQIEILDTQTDYLPHASQPFTLTSPVPLTKWDYLTKRDGVYGWSVNSASVTYDGSDDETYSTYNYNTNSCGVFILNKPNGAVGFRTSLCDRYMYKGKAGNTWASGIAGEYADHPSENKALVVTSLAVGDIESFRAFLFEKTITFQYQTAEEQSFHPLPDEEQELLNNLETYYGVTNLYNDQGCPMWLTYVQDTKIAVDNKFENIKNAIISLGGNV